MNRAVRSTALLAIILATRLAMAEGDAMDPAAAIYDEAVLVVTPQKREQDLQDVPITVTPVSDVFLRDNGVRTLKDLAVLVPGLTVTSTQNETFTTARIRGIGTTGDNPGLESSVGVVIDGVYRPRNGVSFGDIGDLQQIEVIKGPQGTVFGKNTSAGVISITTKSPEFYFQTVGELGAGSFGTQQASAYVTGPLVGHVLAGRLFAALDKRDGFNTVMTGEGPRTFTQDGDRDQYTVRGQLAYRPSVAVFARLFADYARHNENCCGSVQVSSGPTAPLIDLLSTDSGLSNPASPFSRIAYLNRAMPQTIQEAGVSAQLDWDVPWLSDAMFSSITAWRNWDSTLGLDADFTTADLWYRAPDGRFGNEFDQITQELRLASAAGRLKWLVGLFYAREELDSRSHLAYGSDFEPYYSLLFSQGASATLISDLTRLPVGLSYTLNSGLYDQFNQTSDSYALFTNNTFAITEQLEATLGLRYTREQKSLNSLYNNIGTNGAACRILRLRRDRVNDRFNSDPMTLQSFYNFGCGPFADPAFNNFSSTQQIDEDNTSGAAKLAYRFSPQLLSYVSYARGYKASGFNLDREAIQNPTLNAADPRSSADPDTSFAAETGNSYELGFKTNWLENTLLLNAAAFAQRFNNFQLTVFQGNVFVTTTVPTVNSRGVDLDLFWFVLQRSLTLQAGVTYADTSYGNFTTTSRIPTQLPGSHLSFAPQFSGTLAAAYERPISASLRFRASIAGKSTSQYNTGSDLNPAMVQGSYTLVNARLGIGSIKNRWTLEAWGQNLTNEKYYQVIIDAPLQPGTLNGFLADPRTYGVTVRVGF